MQLKVSRSAPSWHGKYSHSLCWKKLKCFKVIFLFSANFPYFIAALLLPVEIMYSFYQSIVIYHNVNTLYTIFSLFPVIITFLIMIDFLNKCEDTLKMASFLDSVMRLRYIYSNLFLSCWKRLYHRYSREERRKMHFNA